jgi:hypothetical protein
MDSSRCPMAFQTIRPEGNVLEGYRPSSVASRFAAEVEG